ncbi:MAG TPA: cellulose biosynthesis protein BcsG [Sutterella sp.]|nr:cellulose biosynthesis protein BcsG [Sutterella sp.]
MSETEGKKPGAAKWGVGFWNVYFIGSLLLAFYGYINLDPLLNLLLLAFVAMPIASRFLSGVRHVLSIAAGAALLYSESWLPGLDAIMSNTANIAQFSPAYVLQLAVDFVNPRMVGVFVLLVAAYVFAKDWVRVSTFSVLGLAAVAAAPLWQRAVEQFAPPPAAVAVSDEPTQMGPAQSGPGTSENIEKWLAQFYEFEKTRRVRFSPVQSTDVPFDVVLLNICSLANDDLEAAGLSGHPVLSRFDVRFDRYNSATSYSGPATNRLLRSACGHPSFSDIYSGRNADCEVMNRLAAIGFKQHLFMDHEGRFDDYVNGLRMRSGLQPPLASQKGYKQLYEAFDGEPIWNTLDVLRHWKSTLESEGAARTVTLFNFVALHDGNRPIGSSRWIPFNIRAKKFLDDLNTFMDEIEKSGRKVLFIAVPEHGAAVRGDKIQVARLREIPSPHITQVPLMVKFFGAPGRISQVHVSEQTSLHAVAALIQRTLERNFFGAQNSAAEVREILTDLPQTYMVSENENASVLKFGNRYYVKMKSTGKWIPLAQ